jgi:hypothetical protein
VARALALDNSQRKGNINIRTKGKLVILKLAYTFISIRLLKLCINKNGTLNNVCRISDVTISDLEKEVKRNNYSFFHLGTQGKGQLLFLNLAR